MVVHSYAKYDDDNKGHEEENVSTYKLMKQFDNVTYIYNTWTLYQSLIHLKSPQHQCILYCRTQTLEKVEILIIILYHHVFDRGCTCMSRSLNKKHIQLVSSDQRPDSDVHLSTPKTTQPFFDIRVREKWSCLMIRHKQVNLRVWLSDPCDWQVAFWNYSCTFILKPSYRDSKCISV